MRNCTDISKKPIAVIDDGILAEVYPELNVLRDLTVNQKGQVRPRNQRIDPILTDHGTTIARIIHKYAPEASFISIKIFHSAVMKTRAAQLYRALKWCYDKRIPVVHLSVGTTDQREWPRIAKIVHKMQLHGQVIVAAESNRGILTAPACLPGVYSVSADPELEGNKWHAVDDEERKIKASSRHELVGVDGKEYVTGVFNSYAAPVVTAEAWKTKNIQKRRI